jgi:hypothetical protein
LRDDGELGVEEGFELLDGDVGVKRTVTVLLPVAVVWLERAVLLTV